MTTDDLYNAFSRAPRATEDLLADELKELGAEEIKQAVSGVSYRATLEVLYRACLWSRVASGVLLELARFPALDKEQLYRGASGVDWAEHLDPSGTLAVDCTLSRAELDHSHYAALVVKDAVVDQFRQRFDRRPSIDTNRPDVRLHLHVLRDEATLSLDLSSESLHRRGYREDGHRAPLKENLAAALLLRARWPEIAARGGALIDPMCGSGTLPVEAAMMATDRAPGLERQYFGFLGWKGHRPRLWQGLLDEARQRRDAAADRLPFIWGSDRDRRAVAVARGNIARAGFGGKIHVAVKVLASVRLPPGAGRADEPPHGLVVINPPYGDRMGEVDQLHGLYSKMGRWLAEHFDGFNAAIITDEMSLARHIGLRAARTNTLYNGPLKCSLLHVQVSDRVRFEYKGQRPELPPKQASEGYRQFSNRLTKNLKRLGRWARRNEVSCYRLYDADMPEYAVAVDVYEGRWAVLQEYAPPRSVDPKAAATRLDEAVDATRRLLGLEHGHLFVKQRRRQRGAGQYERGQDREARYVRVSEGGLDFWVDFGTHLDTGLFLDHRITRQRIRDLARGQEVLNLFAYTCTASVYAAAGGARRTVSVDTSRTYLDWGKKNFLANAMNPGDHTFVRDDCVTWLRKHRHRYGLIFLDPPTFSNSRARKTTLDIQRDHAELIEAAARLLTDDGTLIFSTNHRKFRMDEDALAGLEKTDWSRETLPEDFKRNQRIHRCWRIGRKEE